MIPRATYRLQFYKDFTFGDAQRLVPYLTWLGISHVYASPILTARPGSPHGYDVIDPTQVNPELGGEDGLRLFVATLRRAGLGLIVDFVPNHMYAGNGNAWWEDVLRHGRDSPYAKFFDIDWTPDDPRLANKVLLPILGKSYGETLAAGELTLAKQDGVPVIRYFDRVLPVAPESVAGVHGGLHELLERQHYRLAWWRTASDEINWRRFFDITDLVGVRIEDPDVFEAVHGTLLRLCAERLIDGVRLDHVDGLADPGAYCRRLRERLDDETKGRSYLVVEKILGRNERLPSGWRTDGTVGYDFMDQVAGLLHDPSGEAPLTALWREISGRGGSIAEEEVGARREILARSFTAPFEALVSRLASTAQIDLATRDISRASLRRALAALLARFPLYRTYPDAMENNDSALAEALAMARGDCFPEDRGTLAQLGTWLRQPGRAQTQFQQLTAPLAAKAVEDTAFFRYGRLLSRNDVGFDAERFAYTPAFFHAAMRERLARFPHALLATATHDHKRGEDLRARLAVLSEMPDEWADAVRSCMATHGGLHAIVDGRQAPTAADEYILYQTIVGAWPPRLTLDDRAGCADYAERLSAWQRKAMREAKLATDWMAPNEAYEQTSSDFVRRLFRDTTDGLHRLARFAQRVAAPGAVNGLSQLLLKLTAPGVPDFYQGTEFWDLSLTDPDNRRPVDYAARQAAIDTLPGVAELAEHWRDGRVKQAVIARVLAARKRMPAVFATGDYRPLTVTGPAADHVVAFSRGCEEATAFVIVVRHPSRLLAPDGRIAIPADRWGQTRLSGLQPLAGRSLDAVFGTGSIPLETDMPIATMLRELPIGLFVVRHHK